MRRVFFAVIAAFFGLAGTTTLAKADGLSAKRMVIAVLADDLFVGEAEGNLSGAGTLAIRSQQHPDLTCLGEFTSTAELGGSGQLQCSDGSAATFRFKRLSVFRGFGVASFSRGPMSFAYGIPAGEAEAYLTLPAGKRLNHNGKELVLVNLQQ